MNDAARNLLPLHLDDLHKSGLSDETIRAAGIFTIPPDGWRSVIGFNPQPPTHKTPGVESGYALPYPGESWNGGSRFHRVKIFPPLKSKNGTTKYLQPRDSGARLYMPAMVGDRVNDPAEILHICEGEKKALALAQLRFVAVGMGGVWNWTRKDSGGELIPALAAIPLYSRRVVIVPDSDVWTRPELLRAVGALGVALEAKGADVRVVVVPQDGGEKVGIDDFLAKHGATRATFDALAVKSLTDRPLKGAVTRARRKLAPANADADGVEHFSDLGNAERLVRLHGVDFHRVPAWGAFIVWDGKRWAVDHDGADMLSLAQATVREMYREAAEVEDDSRRILLAGHGRRTEAAQRVRAMIDMTRGIPGVCIAHDRLDQDPWLVNCTNGTLDLRTGTLRPHDQTDFITKIAPVRFNPAATCQTWERFISEVMDGCKALEEYIQRVIGYALTGDVREHVLFFLYGTGRNGKSTLLDAVREMLGADYADEAAPDLLLAKRDAGNHQADRADLFGKRLVTTIEVDDGRAFAEAWTKQTTGGDRLKVRRPYEKAGWGFTPTHKLLLAANHKPVIRGTDLAIWSRIQMIPFTVRFDGTRRDKNLPAKLRAEREGILAWSVRGCLQWQRDGLNPPAEVTAAVETYQREMDPLSDWIEARCDLAPNLRTRAKDLYADFTTWWNENESGDPISPQAFGRKLTERGLEACRESGGSRVKQRRGIALK